MKVTFCYVRHGQTLFNVVRRLQGRCDSPLTEKGIRQAEETAGVLSRMHFSSCRCSPLERAADSAAILCRFHDLVPQVHEELIEFDFGVLDGQKYDEITEIMTGHGDDFTDTGGESSEAFESRMHAFFADVLNTSKDGDTVLVVGHGSWYRHMEHLLFHEHRNPLPNAGIVLFTWEDGVWKKEGGPYSCEEYRKLQKKHVTFYYVRHGITSFNAAHRMQGWSGGQLNETGKKQAETARTALKDVHFDSAYCSTARRAVQTAQIILSGRDIRPVSDKRIKEVFFGNLEGEYYPGIREEVEKRHLTEEWKDIGGESRDEIRERIRSFFTEKADAASDGDTVLCVAHGILYMNVLETLFGISRRDAYEAANGRNPMPGCGIFRFGYEDGEFVFEDYMKDPAEWRGV